MKHPKLGRRAFLRTFTAATGALALTRTLPLPGASAQKLHIEEPFHGAVLNGRTGVLSNNTLKIRVSARAPAAAVVRINGVLAQRQGDQCFAHLPLKRKKNEITVRAQDASGTQEQRVVVLWDRHSFPRYRFSIDDNSFFLRDIAQNLPKSLFDCFYLKLLRNLHQKYGAKFVLNIYYTTGDDFDLRQFPNRYRGEWKDNSNWLKLAFHAHANDPDRPYQNAPAQKVISDLDLVAEQIHRFAGASAYSPPTVTHWAMLQPPTLKALHKRGVRVLSGFFWHRNGKWDINYGIDDQRSEYLSGHDALMDFESGIVFSKVDLVCNATPLEQIVPVLAKIAEDPNQAEIMDLFTHEQYFWPFYKNYLPDHAQRVEAAIRWVTERGYKPVHFHEGFLGA